MIFSGAGGGNPLNFKVVGGTTAPANPKENTIWINTDTEITHTLFCPVDPGPVMNGLVWIATGTSGATGFNALKKNGMIIFPNSAKQYVNSAWVDKTAKIYQNGEWVDCWNGQLYTKGNEWDGVTGGWVPKAWAADTNRAGVLPTVTRTDEYIQIDLPSSASHCGSALHMAKDIDLTKYNLLTLKYSCNEVDGVWFDLIVIDRTAQYYDKSYVARNRFSGPTGQSLTTIMTATIDVSAINGPYDIAICINPAGKTSTVRMHELILS